MIKKVIFFVCVFNISLLFGKYSIESALSWTELPELIPSEGQTYQPGLAGSFSGISKDVMIIAGGANFPKPEWESQKQYHNDIYIYKNDGSGFNWHNGHKLHNKIAYGSSVNIKGGVVCIGGTAGTTNSSIVFYLKWDETNQCIYKQYLPNLPYPLAYGYATKIGNIIYMASGQTGTSLNSATNSLLSLDMSQIPIYNEMNYEELKALADERNISGDSKDKIINALLKSDSLIAHYSELNISVLKEISQNQNIENAEIVSLSNKNSRKKQQWKKLPDIPGGVRAFNITVAQHNGRDNCIYVMSGRRYNSKGEFEFLTDVWEFNPKLKNSKLSWKKCNNLPRSVMAGTGIGIGDSHIFILGGADGTLVSRVNELRENHPGFPKTSLVYHTITDTWTTGSKMPINQVTTRAFKWDKSIIIPTGEIKPRIRTPKIYKVDLNKSESNFGIINSVTLFFYLLGVTLVGFYFMRKNKNTDDFFRGGQKIPWWAASCSIFATMLSSITYMAVPAKSFATNWEYIIAFPAILIVSIFVIHYILPFFRKIDATSAYEYLELRFNKTTRMIASGLFIVFQIGRMAIVLFLSALALSAITPLTAYQSIIIMGVLSILYSTLGGVEAVIWTDTIQTFVLLGGALLACGWIFKHIDGGILSYFSIASADQKFNMINWDWSSTSYMTAAFWIIVLGAFGQNLISYSSDQAVIQRYLTTTDEKKAAKAILSNGIMAQGAGLLFFTIGTALYVFYKTHPSNLDPTFKTDAILPLFIVRELPVGIAGLIVAGIFAAAQSTISTSLNSTSSAVITDFSRFITPDKPEKYFLKQARIVTIIVGILGTWTALMFANSDIKSLFDQFISIIGLFGGSLCGLFLLGIFTERTSGTGAIIGAIFGAIILFIVKSYTQTHFYIYSVVGILSSMFMGYLSSLIFPDKSNTKKLTIFSLNDNIKNEETTL